MLLITIFLLSFLLVEYVSIHCNGVKNRVHIQLLLCFLLLFVFFGFRNLSVLNDTSHYYRYAKELFTSGAFDKRPWYYFNSNLNFEEGFQMFSQIIGKFISLNPYSLILITSFITTISILYFLNKFTTDIAFSVFVLLTSTILLMHYSAIRQSLAVSMSYLFYNFFHKKYYWKAFLCVLIAYYFHNSSIILILPVILYHIKFSKRNIIIILGIAVVISINIYVILHFLGYGDSIYIETQMERDSLPIAQILDTILIFLFFLCYYVINKRYHLSIFQDKLFLSFVFSSIIMNLVAIPFLAFSRYNMFFSQYVVILFVNSLSAIPNRGHRIVIKYIIILILLVRFFIIMTYRNEWFHLLPYSFFDFSSDFQKMNFGY